MAAAPPPPDSPDPEAATKGWPNWSKRALLESALIVFSVFLALALDSWREDMQTRRRVDEVRRYFVEEITANRQQLASPAYGPLHVEAARAWHELAQKPKPTVADRDTAWAVSPNGLHPFKGRDAVWRSFGSSNLLEHMPSRQVFALAEVYRSQEELEDHNAALMALLRTITPDDQSPPFIRSQAIVVRGTLSDITYSEARLLRLYDKALAELANGPPKRQS